MHRYVPPRFTFTPRLDAGVVRARRLTLRANGVGEADVRHQALAEEGGDAAARAVEELIGDHEIARLDAPP